MPRVRGTAEQQLLALAGEKRCKGCSAAKKTTEFAPSRRNWMGVAQRCRPCMSLYSAQRRALAIGLVHTPLVRCSKEESRQKLKAKWNRKGARRRASTEGTLENRVRNAVWRSLNGCKNSRTFALLGYSRQDLAAALEKKFLPGMAWSNFGQWHIDHERPISSFNITSADCEDFKKCWSLSNLQPLWATDNIKKGNRYV